MSIEDQEKTAFISPLVKFQFKRMPFGLKNAPSTFQKLVDDLFDGTSEFVVAYIDNIIVYSETWEEHQTHLEEAFSRIKEAGLTLRPDKCSIGKYSCEFLGHNVGSGTIRPLEAKVTAIHEFVQPSDEIRCESFCWAYGILSTFYSKLCGTNS